LFTQHDPKLKHISETVTKTSLRGMSVTNVNRSPELHWHSSLLRPGIGVASPLQ